MPKLIDLTGQRFGRLQVIAGVFDDKTKRTKWLCKCDCGNEITAMGGNLRRGATKSCGCLYEERAHRNSNSRLYSIWTGMKTRCYNPNHQRFQDYGGRGIVVCDEWKGSFRAFYEWAMGNGYLEDLTLDRIDNDKGYSPDNCRWATRLEQQNNRSCNRNITYNGRTQTITQWAHELGITKETLFARLTRYHWDIERAMQNCDFRR